MGGEGGHESGGMSVKPGAKIWNGREGEDGRKEGNDTENNCEIPSVGVRASSD